MASGAPIQDLAFHNNSSGHTPSSSSSRNNNRRFIRRNSNSSDVSRGSMESASSTASARRRFFPSTLFGGSSGSGGQRKGSNMMNPAAAAGLPPAGPSSSRSARRPNGDAIVVKSMKVWDCKMPPVKKHMVSNHLVPTMRGAARLFIQKQRRISIEVHGAPVYSADSSQSISSCMTPAKAGRMKEFLSGGSPKPDDMPLQDKDVVFVRVLRLSHDHEDSHSPSSHHLDGDDDEDLSTLGPYAPDDTDGSFVEHYSYRLEDVEVLKRHGRTCEMRFGSGKETSIRDIKFEAEKEAILFDECLDQIKDRVQERARRMAEEYKKTRREGAAPVATKPCSTARSADMLAGRMPIMTTTPTKPNQKMDQLEILEEGDVEMIRLLFDIVSAIDLPVTDLLSTDAYVIVRLGSKEVHRTKVVFKTRNPIWTIETESLFLLEMPSTEFFASTSGLTFLIKDFDPIGRNEVIGRVVLSHDEVLKGTGERIHYTIVPDKARKARSKQSRLVLRFKEASPGDVEFMRGFRCKNSRIGIYAEETFLGPRPPDSTLLKRSTKKVGREELHRIKPYPDPDDPEKTRWMSKASLQAEALKESKQWVEAGSGDMGKLYVEIISCDGLPNMDVNLNPRDKTDAFVCLVYEDAVVNTDVIGDTMKPRWMPWCSRAFVFNISHPQSNLFLGIFDYDPPDKISQKTTQSLSTVHDPIGRVSVNLGRYVPGNVYNLTFPLYLRKGDAEKQEARGSVTIRLRVEWENSRRVIIKGAKPPEPTYVSCVDKVNWNVVHYTADGDRAGGKEFSLRALSKHVAELKTYSSLPQTGLDGLLSLILWKGHYGVKLCGREILLPLHSMTAFFWGMLIGWNFDFLPAFFAFSIGWILLAMNSEATKNPSPWQRPRGYWDIFFQFLLKRNGEISIDPNQNVEAYGEFLERSESARKRAEAERKIEQIEEEQLREEYSEDIAKAQGGDVEIATKKERFVTKLHPFKPFLHPVQLQLELIVVTLRVLKSIARWDEPLFAFWLATASFVASFAMLWIPWGFLLVWSFRIAVFVFLGPWIAIYYRLVYSRKSGSPEEKIERMKNRVRRRYVQVKEAATLNRSMRERAEKLKSMKKYLYGKYLVNVPRFCVEGSLTSPLPSSSARPFKRDKSEPVKVVKRKYGQNLSGDMIPITEFQAALLDEKDSKVKVGRFRNFLNRRRKDGEVEPLLGDGRDGSENTEYQSVGDQEHIVKTTQIPAKTNIVVARQRSMPESEASNDSGTPRGMQEGLSCLCRPTSLTALGL